MNFYPKTWNIFQAYSNVSSMTCDLFTDYYGRFRRDVMLSALALLSEY